MMSRNLSYLLVVFLVLATISDQIGAYVTFAEQPSGKIYAYVGEVLVVRCRAYNSSTTLYLNSTPYNIHFLPPRYGAETDSNDVVIGFVVSGVQVQDNGTSFSCSVGAGATLVLSTVGTLIVRDGAPGSVGGVAQIGQPSLYCTTVRWSPAPFPPDSPVLLYTITVATVGSQVVATYNISADEVQSSSCGLSPNTAYSVTVVALNDFGYGDTSNITVWTSLPLVLTPPSDVQAVLVTSPDGSTMISISWHPPPVDTDLMTPLMAYVVFHGTDVNHTSNITSTPNTTSALIRGVRVGVAYVIGVAALNSAGLSNVTYTYLSIPISTPLPPSIAITTATTTTTSIMATTSTMATSSTTSTMVTTSTAASLAVPTGMLVLPTSSPVNSLAVFYIVLGCVGGVVLTLVLVMLLLIACVVWKKNHISSINIRSLEAAGGGAGGSPDSVKKFTAAVSLKPMEVSPVLRHSQIMVSVNTSTPCSSEASGSANSSPLLCDTSGDAKLSEGSAV